MTVKKNEWSRTEHEHFLEASTIPMTSKIMVSTTSNTSTAQTSSLNAAIALAATSLAPILIPKSKAMLVMKNARLRISFYKNFVTHLHTSRRLISVVSGRVLNYSLVRSISTTPASFSSCTREFQPQIRWWQNIFSFVSPSVSAPGINARSLWARTRLKLYLFEHLQHAKSSQRLSFYFIAGIAMSNVPARHTLAGGWQNPEQRSPSIWCDAFGKPSFFKNDTAVTRLLRALRVLRRIVRHLLLFTPVLLVLPFVYCASFFSPHILDVWWRWLLWTVQVSGPAFIKFVQWGSSRRDIFSKNVCDRFSQLHACVRTHAFYETQKTLTAAFGDGWQEYLEITPTPVGSGCVAQVYRAKLAHHDEILDVAVKVIHPEVQRRVLDDIEVMRFIAWMIELVPGLHWTSAADSVEEYSRIMVSQLDLRNEARNMVRFHDNFKDEHDVAVPNIVPEFVSEHVLVESFEEGVPIDMLFDADMSVRRKLARRCVELFFKMMFDHNFVHGDLHPGNLQIKGFDDQGHMTSRDLKILLLDGGIATELSYKDRINFVDLFSAIVHRDGREAGRLLLERTKLQECSNPNAFIDEIDDLIQAALSKGITLRRIRMGELLQRVLSLMCRHKVKIESNFTSIVIGIMVAEGVGRSLDPEVDLISLVSPLLLREKARLSVKRHTGRLFGSL